jgi:hypothetical protein
MGYKTSVKQLKDFESDYGLGGDVDGDDEEEEDGDEEDDEDEEADSAEDEESDSDSKN